MDDKVSGMGEIFFYCSLNKVVILIVAIDEQLTLGAILLVGMGYEFLSMSSANLLRVKAILRQLTLSEMSHFADQACLLTDSFTIENYLKEALDRPEITRLIRPTTSPSLN